MTTLAALILAVVPLAEPLRERCDVIELNHMYDGEGRLVFDQVIFWDWTPDECRYQVRAWRIVKWPSQIPERDHARACWRTVFRDGEVLRVVESQSMGETWTQYDPEVFEREVLPIHRRRGLAEVVK